MIHCIRCKDIIPEGRLKALPGVKTCVKCSTSKMKRSITVTRGEREDTYNDLIILDSDDFDRLQTDRLEEDI